MTFGQTRNAAVALNLRRAVPSQLHFRKLSHVRFVTVSNHDDTQVDLSRGTHHTETVPFSVTYALSGVSVPRPHVYVVAARAVAVVCPHPA